jgi:hypothetical protein
MKLVSEATAAIELECADVARAVPGGVVRVERRELGNRKRARLWLHGALAFIKA